MQVWDVARRCCVHVWNDSGGLRTTALAASADGQIVAAGSDSGAVSLSNPNPNPYPNPNPNPGPGPNPNPDPKP